MAGLSGCVRVGHIKRMPYSIKLLEYRAIGSSAAFIGAEMRLAVASPYGFSGRAAFGYLQ
jgi:hypothetical protein